MGHVTLTAAPTRPSWFLRWGVLAFPQSFLLSTRSFANGAGLGSSQHLLWAPEILTPSYSAFHWEKAD